MMAPKSKKLTVEEFASLLKVGNTCAVLEPPAVIPAEHSSRLIGLGYMAYLAGRLRMTIDGRQRIAAAENQKRRIPKAAN
jgi:transcriptional regulator with XRE-family HTH domain